MVQIANTTALGQNSAKPVWHQQPHCSDLHGPGAVPPWNQFCLILLCLSAFLSFASLQYLIDELSSQGLLLSYSSKKKLCDKHRIQVCHLQSLGRVGLSPVLVRSMCGSTCKSGASRVLEHSTHKINLLILSKSQLSWDTSTLCVWSIQHQPGHTMAWSLVHGWVLDTENSSSAFFCCCRSE